MKIDLKNVSGKSVGSIDLDDSVFAAEIHEHLLWEVVKWQRAKRRAGTASTKRIGEVRGSAKKVWKQKGTGQARQGSKQAPHWVGGGSVFGPKPRSYEYDMPKKAKKLALRSALSLRASENKLVIVDKLELDGKTKTVSAAFNILGSVEKKKVAKVLVVDAKNAKGEHNAALARGAKNLPASQWLAAEGINVYDILRHETLVLTAAALKDITAALAVKE